jgi:hypothetical protein
LATTITQKIKMNIISRLDMQEFHSLGGQIN